MWNIITRVLRSIITVQCSIFLPILTWHSSLCRGPLWNSVAMKSENVQQPHRVLVEDVVGPYVSLTRNGAFRPFVCPVGIMGWAFHPLAMRKMGNYDGGVSGCGKSAKYGLFVTNGLILVGSLVVFGLGLWIIIDNSYANELLGTNLFAGAMYVLTVTALLSIGTAILGYLGAVREVKGLLLTYFIILFVIFVCMLIGAILGFVFREKVSQTMRQEMISSIRMYGNRKYVTWAWDRTQSRLHCCGVDYYRDWKGKVPESCCQEIYGGQRKPCVSFPNLDNIYNNGCYNVTATVLQKYTAAISGAGIGLGFIMIFSLVFSCILFVMIE